MCVCVCHRPIRNQTNTATMASVCKMKSQTQLDMVAYELKRVSSKKPSGASIRTLIDEEMSKGMRSGRHSPGVIAKLMGLDALPASSSVSCRIHRLAAVKDRQKRWPRGGRAISRRRKRDELHEQKSTEGNRLQSSRQFSETLDALQSNKDLFLKLLQEPSSLFVRHLEEYQSTSASSEASQIVVLKSSNLREHDNGGGHWESDGKMDRSIRIRERALSKYEDDLVSHCIKEHSLSVSRKKCSLGAERRPTRIVVLKPSLDDVLEATGQKSAAGHSGYARRRESRRFGDWEMLSEMKERKKLSGEMLATNRTRGSRGIAREITDHMESFGSGHGRSLPGRRENSCGSSRRSHRLDKTCDSSTFKSSVSKEARKRLSERWKTTHELQDAGAPGRCSSTLGEMLALSEREVPEMPLRSLSCLEYSCDMVSREEILARWGSPLGITSGRSRRDEFSCRSPSKFIPESALTHGRSSSYDFTSHSGSSALVNDDTSLDSLKSSEGSLAEKKRLLRESYGDRHDFQSTPDLVDLPEEKTMVSDPDASAGCDASYPVDFVPAVCTELKELPCVTDDLMPAHPFDSTPRELKEVASSDECRTEGLPPLPIAKGQEFSSALEVTEHPSPVSVLEPPDESESSLDRLERVKGDLQEFRPQHQLPTSVSEDAEAEGIRLTFENEDNMEFCYLLDILIDSGLYKADGDMLFCGCFSPESPVDPDVFENLESIYNQVAWPGMDRKLIFDLINSILAEILAFTWVGAGRLRPSGCRKLLIEEVWESLLKSTVYDACASQGKDVEELTWRGCGADFDGVGREIERMLNDDLLEELATEVSSI
ncbi:unnamed protein product [Spirodela intermedia]|uniref:Uncharacterized protein n=1 Tax=Spirodela intermedia TaxID=51605 RepID=A0A7I8JHG9_SPIIN|nr:unnamed protein product [Spirodela intermedia]CAA6669361.1 unnamed protein product [Spirodela intermedia]